MGATAHVEGVVEQLEALLAGAIGVARKRDEEIGAELGRGGVGGLDEGVLGRGLGGGE